MKPTRIALTLSLVAFVSLGTRGIVAQNSDARLKARIDSLEAGIRAEEAVRAVKRLQHTYSHYIESGLWNDVADLFADNAVGRFQDETVTGKAGLREYFMKQAQRTSLGLAKGQLNVHLTLQPIITLGADGKSGKGAWFWKVAYDETLSQTSPGVQLTLDLTEEMKRQNIKIILVEPYFDLQTPNKIARDTGAKVLVMTPSVGGVKEATSYMALFDYDVNLIVSALKGAGK